MRLTLAFLAHELRTQRRSLRYRVATGAYLFLGCLPAALVHVRRSGSFFIGPASYAWETFAVLPLLTALFAALVALDGIHREKEDGAWSTLSVAGMSNAGYVLRRWLALQTVILPWTAVPPFVAAAVAAADRGAALLDPLVFAGPWLLHVLPLALAVSTLSFALGTIGGGAVNAVLLQLGIGSLLQLALGRALFRFGYRLGSPFGWLDVDTFNSAADRIATVIKPPRDDYFPLFPTPASETGIDLRVLAEQHLAEGAFLLGLAALALGAAVLFLGRSRPDVRPWRIRPDHPLRTYLKLIARARQSSRPDPRPARADLLAAGLAALGLAAALGLLVHRLDEYAGLGRRRYAAETRGGAGTPTAILPGDWRIQGRTGATGAVDLQVAAELRNTGTVPCPRLSFQLNPELEIGQAVDASGRRLTLRRDWDHLEVTLSPPLPPGGRADLGFHLRGTPSWPAFSLESSLPQTQRSPFAASFRRFLGARFAHDLSDLSRSYQVPAVSRQQVDLDAADLIPLPRYQTWDLRAEQVPPESYFPNAGVELALGVPAGVFLADACGGTVRGGRLESRCRLPLADLAVVGGPHRPLPAGGTGSTVAVFPGHAGPGGPGEIHLGFLGRGAGLLQEAWPGLGDLRQAVFLEWAGREMFDRRANRWRWAWYYSDDTTRIRVRGNLVFLPEEELVRTRPLSPESLVAELVSARLARRRPLRPEDSFFFRQLFRQLALKRLGLGSPSGAVLGPLRPSMESVCRVPATEESYSIYWGLCFPSMVAALEERVGAESLRQIIDGFLAESGGGDATAQELLARIRERSEAPVERLIQDYFVDGRVPEPVLEEVHFQAAAGGGWRATGRVHNLGDGEALCRVVLSSDLGSSETVVSAGTGQSVSFELRTPHRPQAVLLDPDNQCHRLVRNGVPRDRVYFEGGRN